VSECYLFVHDSPSRTACGKQQFVIQNTCTRDGVRIESIWAQINKNCCLKSNCGICLSYSLERFMKWWRYRVCFICVQQSLE